jgi:hypothetical protein
VERRTEIREKKENNDGIGYKEKYREKEIKRRKIEGEEKEIYIEGGERKER